MEKEQIKKRQAQSILRNINLENIESEYQKNYERYLFELSDTVTINGTTYTNTNEDRLKRIWISLGSEKIETATGCGTKGGFPITEFDFIENQMNILSDFNTKNFIEQKQLDCYQNFISNRKKELTESGNSKIQNQLQKQEVQLFRLFEKFDVNGISDKIHNDWMKQELENLMKKPFYLERKELINDLFLFFKNLNNSFKGLDKKIKIYNSENDRFLINDVNVSFENSLDWILNFKEFNEIINLNVTSRKYQIASELKSTVILLFESYFKKQFKCMFDSSIENTLFGIYYIDVLENLKSIEIPKLTVNIENDFSHQTKEAEKELNETDNPFTDPNNFELFYYFLENWKQPNSEKSKYTYFFDYFKDYKNEVFSQKQFFIFVEDFTKKTIAKQRQSGATRSGFDDYLKDLEIRFNKKK